MARKENYKVMLSFSRKEDASEYTMSDIIGGEFYNLKQDPREWNDLYESEEVTEIKEDMTKQLMAKLSTMSCLVPN